MNLNVNLMEKNIIQINGGIMINVDMSAKNIIYVENIMFRILLLVIVKMESIWQVLWIKLFVMKLRRNKC